MTSTTISLSVSRTLIELVLNSLARACILLKRGQSLGIFQRLREPCSSEQPGAAAKPSSWRVADIRLLHLSQHLASQFLWPTFAASCRYKSFLVVMRDSLSSVYSNARRSASIFGHAVPLWPPLWDGRASRIFVLT